MAEKLFKHVLEYNQKHLSIGFDKGAGHLTLKQEGVDATKLPQAEKDLQIYKHKIVDNSTVDQRYDH